MHDDLSLKPEVERHTLYDRDLLCVLLSKKSLVRPDRVEKDRDDGRYSAKVSGP